MPKPKKTKDKKKADAKNTSTMIMFSALLLSGRLATYDSGAKPTSHSNCKFGCKQHFLGMANGATVLRQNLSK